MVRGNPWHGSWDCNSFFSRQRRRAVLLCIKKKMMIESFTTWSAMHSHKKTPCTTAQVVVIYIKQDKQPEKREPELKATSCVSTIPQRCLAPACNHATASCKIRPCSCKTVWAAPLNNLPFLSFHMCQIVNMNMELSLFLLSLTWTLLRLQQ